MTQDKKFQVNLVQEDYKMGYLDGFKNLPLNSPHGVDMLSYSSGYIEGKADRLDGKGARYENTERI